MGKRKERRLAAMAASRRVKLDIFAEPSGDSGGSPAEDELGGEIDLRHHEGSPNSPSSSGKQPENPLLLLGQYSDDELEEQSSERFDNSTAKKATVVENEQDNGPVGTGKEDMQEDAGVNVDVPNDKERRDLEECGPRQIDNTGAAHLYKEEIFTEEMSNSRAADVQSTTDANTIWKVVLHEESNQYYYWNTVTGETSWTVPNELVLGTELTGERETVPHTGEGSSPLAAGVEQLNSTLDVETNGSFIPATARDELEEMNEPGSQVEDLFDRKNDGNLEDTNQGPDSSQTDKSISNPMAHEDNDMENDLCSSVLKHGEFLLERLKSMESSKSEMDRNDWISRYMLEVEIRVSDAKSLLSFGASLLPFWVHCERKLKELEVAIDTEVPLFSIPKTHEVEATHASQDNEGLDMENGRNNNSMGVSDSRNIHVSTYVDASMVGDKDTQNEAASSLVLSGERFPVTTYSTSHSGISVGEDGGGETERLTEATTMTMPQTEEDVDMDVDMEVEDTKEHQVQSNPPLESVTLILQEDFDVPPPPGEEWVPPPPPDSEPVPPPPPDDTAEPSYPPPPAPDNHSESSCHPLPTYSQTLQPLAYTEHYNYSYPSSNLDYYSQTNTEFAVPNPPLYYETQPLPYPGTAQVILNPVEPVSGYDLQNDSVAPAPIASGAESYGLSGHGASSGSYTDSSMNPHVEMGRASLSNPEVGVSVVNGGTEREYVGVPSIQAPSSTNSAVSSSHVPSATVVTTSVSSKSVTASVQSKVLRSKKRTIAAAPSLRSNKKVSSLVDKWNAAKEELHEHEEDEPETAYEILEKKRQREIEKWRAQQIASGEAKDNANFQPLGGDWRERVKRKRAQMEKKDAEPSAEAASDGNKQPNLADLSRDLPSGWQAYWDESSKQVYYGNAITSETTWTRPAK